VTRRLWLLAVSTLAPAAALLGVRSHVNQIGGLDPFFYTSLVLDLQDWVARYGDTYHSLRLAHIAPAAVLVRCFGPVAGYLAYRAGLLSLIAGAGFGIGLRCGLEPALAAAASLWLAVNPPMLRSLLWDNPDGTALACMFATSLCQLAAVDRLANGPRATWPAFGAGAFYCLAANAHPLTGLVQIGLFGAAGVLLLREGARGRPLVAAATWATTGFAAAYLALVATRALLLPGRPLHWDPLALRVVRGLPYETWWLGGVVAQLKESQWAPLVPVVFGAAALLAAWRGGLLRRAGRATVTDRLMLLTLGYLCWTVAVYVALDRVLKMSVIRVFYHRIYVLPALSLVVVALLSRALAQARAPVRQLSAAGIATCVLALHFAGLRAYDLMDRLPWTFHATVAGVLLCVCALGALQAGWLGSALVSLALVLVPAVEVRGPDGAEPRGIYADRERLQWDVYKAAVMLKQAIRTLPPADGATGFWYANDHTHLNSIQSVYFWNASRMSDGGPERRGMPVVEEEFLARLPAYRFVCLLGESPAEIGAGRRALLSMRPGAVAVREGGWTGRAYSAYFEVLDTRARSAGAPP
jgi:hypothetical protein